MAEKIIIDLDVSTSKGKQQVDELNKSINKTNKEVTDVSESSKQLTSSLDSVSGGAVSAFKNLKTGLSTAVGGFNSLKVAIIGTGIGALIIAILAVKEAFTSSEEGQNKFAKIMGVIGSITGNLSDLLSDLGMAIIEVFENPKKAITDFANLIKDNIVNRFNGLLELIPELGRAINLLFQGEFTKAGEVAANASAKVALGVDNIVQKTKEATQSTKDFIAELQREARIASQIADNRAKADKLDRGLIVERSVADRNRAELLEKAQQRGVFSIKERTKFLQEASKIDEDITNKEIKSAKLRFNAIVEENKLSKSNKEALDAEANAKAKIIDLETARLRKQKLVTSQITGLIEQEASANKTASDARKKVIEDEQKLKEETEKKQIADDNLKAKERLDALEEIRKAEIDTEAERRAEQLLQVQLQYDLLIQKAILYNQSTNELTEAQRVKKLELQVGFDEQDKKRADDLIKNQIEIAEVERKLAHQKIKDKSMVVDAIAQFADAESGIGKALLILKQALALKETIMDIKRITFKGIEAVGSAGVATAENVAQSSKIGFPQNLITIAGAIAQGVGIISSVKSAVSKTKAGAISSGIGVPNISTPNIPSLPPAFNVVGASSTNQLADAIGGQSKEPVKAYVVSNDVTSAQSMDRNIVNGASI